MDKYQQERLSADHTVRITKRVKIVQLPAGTQAWIRYTESGEVEGPYPAVAIAFDVQELSWDSPVDRSFAVDGEGKRKVTGDFPASSSNFGSVGPYDDLDVTGSKVLLLSPNPSPEPGQWWFNAEGSGGTSVHFVKPDDAK